MRQENYALVHGGACALKLNAHELARIRIGRAAPRRFNAFLLLPPPHCLGMLLASKTISTLVMISRDRNETQEMLIALIGSGYPLGVFP